LTFGNFILLKEKNDQKGPLQEYSTTSRDLVFAPANLWFQ